MADDNRRMTASPSRERPSRPKSAHPSTERSLRPVRPSSANTKSNRWNWGSGVAGPKFIPVADGFYAIPVVGGLSHTRVPHIGRSPRDLYATPLGHENAVPSRWRDKVVSEEVVQKSASRLYGDAFKRNKKLDDARSVTSTEISVDSRWRMTKPKSEVEAGFDRLFDDSKRYHDRAKKKPKPPVKGTLVFKDVDGAGYDPTDGQAIYGNYKPAYKPAPQLSREEYLAKLLKQYYRPKNLQLKKKKTLYDKYCAGLSDEQKRLLGIDKEPDFLSDEQYLDMATKMWEEFDKAEEERQTSLSEAMRNMYQQARDYREDREKKVEKRDEEMRTRLKEQFAAEKAFIEKLMEEREESARKEREAMRAQKKEYKASQAAIEARHTEEAVQRLAARAEEDRKRREEKEKRDAEREEYIRSSRRAERERAIQIREDAEKRAKESGMCRELNDFQKKMEDTRVVDAERREEAAKSERRALREAQRAYREKLMQMEEKQNAELDSKKAAWAKSIAEQKAADEAREESRREQQRLWRQQDKERKKMLAERMEARIAQKREEKKAWA